MSLKDLRDSVADVLRTECSLDKVHKHTAGGLDLATEVEQLAGELGWGGICVDESRGGLGLGVDALCVIGEELGRALAPGSIPASLIAVSLVAEHGSDQLRSEILPLLLAGELNVAIHSSLLAELPADASLVLGSPDAQLVIAASFGEGEPELDLLDLRGMPDALVERHPWDPTRRLCALSGGELPKHRLSTRAYRSAVRMFALMIAADSLGLSEAIVAKTLEYLSVREQFGKKIGSFQALKHRMADLYIDQHLKRSLIEHAAQQDDAGDDGVAFDWALLSKAEASDAAAFATAECMQLHGAIGFTWEHDCHLFLKRARLNQALVGDNDLIRVQCAKSLYPTLETTSLGEVADAAA